MRKISHKEAQKSQKVFVILVADEIFKARNSPPWPRRGGRAIKKMVPLFGGAAGVVGSTSNNRWLEPTTPAAPAKEAARHFVDGRSLPSLAKEGSSTAISL